MDLTHDIDKGVLNGVVFDVEFGEDPQIMIKPVPCEVCGHPIWLGVIISSCGDAGRDIYQENSDGFERHRCDQNLEPDDPMCEVCFPDEEEDDLDKHTCCRLQAALYSKLDDVSVAR